MSAKAHSLAKLCFVLMAPFLTAISTTALTINDVWINEIHYDNDGGDTNEFIELAAQGTTDLTGLLMTLYNGSDKKADDSYGIGDADLDTIIDGIRYLVFDIAGIQNGAPDGVSLSASGFSYLLSYEGSFTALDGPVAGAASEVLGYEEGESTLVGHSLQLIGNGSQYSDFTWSGPQKNTRGYANRGQSLTPLINANTSSSKSVSDPVYTFSLLSLAFTSLVIVRRKQTSF